MSSWSLFYMPVGSIQFSSVQFSCSIMSDSLWPRGLQHARLPFPSSTPGACSNSLSLSHWVSDATQPSHLIFCRPLLFLSSIFPCMRVFPMSQSFASGGQSIGVSASASILPMSIQDWFPLEWIDWVSLQSKGVSRVFSNTTVQKHQFFGIQLCL